MVRDISGVIRDSDSVDPFGSCSARRFSAQLLNNVVNVGVGVARLSISKVSCFLCCVGGFMRAIDVGHNRAHIFILAQINRFLVGDVLIKYSLIYRISRNASRRRCQRLSAGGYGLRSQC